MSGRPPLPPFEDSLAAILVSAKEAVLAPMRPKLRELDITEPQWRVMRVLDERGTTARFGAQRLERLSIELQALSAAIKGVE